MTTTAPVPTYMERLFLHACDAYEREGHRLDDFLHLCESGINPPLGVLASESAQQIAATYAKSSQTILLFMLDSMVQSVNMNGIYKEYAALAIQNPNIHIETLLRFMRLGRAEYLRFRGYANQTSIYWMYDNGMKNPIWALYALEDPDRYRTLLVEFGAI